MKSRIGKYLVDEEAEEAKGKEDDTLLNIALCGITQAIENWQDFFEQVMADSDVSNKDKIAFAKFVKDELRRLSARVAELKKLCR